MHVSRYSGENFEIYPKQKEQTVDMYADGRLDARHLLERNHVRKASSRFFLSRRGALMRQDFCRVYKLFSTLLQYLVTNEQTLQVTREKFDALEQRIDDLVSLFCKFIVVSSKCY